MLSENNNLKDGLQITVKEFFDSDLFDETEQELKCAARLISDGTFYRRLKFSSIEICNNIIIVRRVIPFNFMKTVFRAFGAIVKGYINIIPCVIEVNTIPCM